MATTKKTWGESLSLYVFLFLFFCVIGWLYEVILAFLYGYGFINRGFLIGPYLPLYGFGALILIFCLQKVMATPMRLGRVSFTPVVVFFLIVLITTVIEYVVSYLLEVIFDMRWWDYSTYDYNLNGRICLSASIRFGIGGMVFLYLLTPLFKKLIGKMPPKTQRVLAWVVVGILAVDFVLTLYIASSSGFNPELAQPR